MRTQVIYRAIRALFYLLIFAAVSDTALAQGCDGRIISSQEVLADYNPFDPIALQRHYSVTIENSGNKACRYRLRFEPGLAEGEFSFRVKSAEGSLLADSGGRSDAWSWLSSRIVDPGGHQIFTLGFELPAGQFLSPGRLMQTLSLVLEDDSGKGGDAVLDRASPLFACLVGDYLGVNIAGAGLARTVDFGELVEGDSRRIVIEARANRNFLLEIESAKGGAMAMASPNQQWRIPYHVTLDGRIVKLPHMAGPFSRGGVSGQSFSLDFRIGDASAKRAGLYTDEIVVIIRPAL